MTTETLFRETATLLAEFGVALGGGDFPVASPIDGSRIAAVQRHDRADLERMIAAAERAFVAWRSAPPPRRGEVQEMIDICDFAVGLSRQLYGRVIASERPGHRMLETWHPLGPVGIITAFNFPVAVWSWNAAIALVCGDSLIWKPSDQTPLCALACHALLGRAIERFGGTTDELRRGLSQVAIGGAELGETLADDRRVPLVSATGSTRMGAMVGPRVAQRFGHTILELGGNNGMIVAPSADLDLALRAILFAAVGTAGQRCTSLRRLFVHEDIAETLVPRLRRAYAQVRIGNPLEAGTLI